MGLTRIMRLDFQRIEDAISGKGKITDNNVFGVRIYESQEESKVFEKIREVYRLFEDKDSKDIFLNRVLWNITGDKKYIDEVVSVYFERMKRTWKSPKFADEVKKMRDLIGTRRVIIYGIGNCGLVTLALFCSEMQDADLVAFCDKAAGKVSQFYGYTVLKAEDIISDYQDAIVLISPVEKKVKKEIIRELLENGVNRAQIIDELPFADGVIREQYFDDIIVLEKGETFIDAGAFDCGTDIDFIMRCPDYKEIIAFEPDPTQYANCLKRIEVCQIHDIKIHNVGLWNKKETLPFLEGGGSSRVSDKGTIMVQLDALDYILSEGVTYIKMDIEGAELKGLEGARNIIMNYKPKLAICVYHKSEDIIDIPLYIHKIVPEYKFYLRHHSKTDAETVLYAVIK